MNSAASAAGNLHTWKELQKFKSATAEAGMLKTFLNEELASFSFDLLDSLCVLSCWQRPKYGR